MAVLDVLHYPDERLRTIAQPVEAVTPEIQQLIADMIDTMNHLDGMGLAASQVDVHKRVIVIATGADYSDIRAYVNPVITPLDDETITLPDGCLSVPGMPIELALTLKVTRHKNVNLKALDRNGQPVDIDVRFDFEKRDFLSIALQHEVDHLNGVVYVDYLTPEQQAQVCAAQAAALEAAPAA